MVRLQPLQCPSLSAHVFSSAEAIRQAVASRVVVCREDVWLTSKINSREHGGSKTRKAINSSCNRIEDVQPLDLMLLHDACSVRLRNHRCI